LFLSAGALVAAQDPAERPVSNSDASASLPAPPADSDPQTFDWHARLKLSLKETVGPQALAQTVMTGLYDHARNYPREWGRKPVRIGDRIGSEYAQVILKNSIELAFYAIHKEDPRYVRLGAGGFWKRTGHAFKNTVWVSDTRGGQTISLGQIAGNYGSWAIASQWWEPKSEQGFGTIMMWGSVNMLTQAGTNLVHEFWPGKRSH
jgi:hypothetical protein